MRFVTYADNDGDRVGVVDGDNVYTLAPGIRLIDLLGDPDQLRDAGQNALRQPHAVTAVREVCLRAPIPHPRTVGRTSETKLRVTPDKSGRRRDPLRSSLTTYMCCRFRF